MTDETTRDDLELDEELATAAEEAVDPFIRNARQASVVTMLREWSREWRDVVGVLEEYGQATNDTRRIGQLLWRLGVWRLHRPNDPPSSALGSLDELRAELEGGLTPDTGPRPRLLGTVRVDHSTRRSIVVDARGPAAWRFCSWFPALRIWRDSTRAAIGQLDQVAEYYAGVRVFGAVGGATEWGDGGTGWAGREVAPVTFRNDRGDTIAGWGDYADVVQDFLEACRARSLRVHLTNGDLQHVFPGGRGEGNHHARLGRLSRPFGQTVALYEPHNEGWQNAHNGQDPNRTAAMAERFRAENPAPLLALSASPTGEEPPGLRDWTSEDGILTHHGKRHTWVDAVRRAFNVSYETMQQKRLVTRTWLDQGEPAGPDGIRKDVYQPINDPRHLFALYMIHAIAGQGSTWFSGPSIRYLEATETLASTWGFVEIPWLLQILPSWLQAAPRLWGGHRSEAAVTADPFEDQGEGPHRVDQAVADDGSVVALAYGDNTFEWNLRARRRLEYELVTHRGSVFPERRTINAGERFTEPETRNRSAGGTHAVLIIGRPVS